jgi:hypothetical protein
MFPLSPTTVTTPLFLSSQVRRHPRGAALVFSALCPGPDGRPGAACRTPGAAPPHGQPARLPPPRLAPPVWAAPPRGPRPTLSKNRAAKNRPLGGCLGPQARGCGNNHPSARTKNKGTPEGRPKNAFCFGWPWGRFPPFPGNTGLWGIWRRLPSARPPGPANPSPTQKINGPPGGVLGPLGRPGQAKPRKHWVSGAFGVLSQ